MSRSMSFVQWNKLYSLLQNPLTIWTSVLAQRRYFTLGGKSALRVPQIYPQQLVGNWIQIIARFCGAEHSYFPIPNSEPYSIFPVPLHLLGEKNVVHFGYSLVDNYPVTHENAGVESVRIGRTCHYLCGPLATWETRQAICTPRRRFLSLCTLICLFYCSTAS